MAAFLTNIDDRNSIKVLFCIFLHATENWTFAVDLWSLVPKLQGSRPGRFRYKDLVHQDIP